MNSLGNITCAINVWDSFQPNKSYGGLVRCGAGAREELISHMVTIVPEEFRVRVVLSEIPIIPGMPDGGVRWEYEGIECSAPIKMVAVQSS